MNRQIIGAAALAAGLALLPVWYLHSIWPAVPALVPMHYSPPGLTPDHFVGRQWLWNIGWLPGIAFAVLTFLPQVQAGQSLFWSSRQQRRARLVVVGVLALYTTQSIYYGAKLGRELTRLSPSGRMGR